jgi:hypothetical protein
MKPDFLISYCSTPHTFLLEPYFEIVIASMVSNSLSSQLAFNSFPSLSGYSLRSDTTSFATQECRPCLQLFLMMIRGSCFQCACLSLSMNEQWQFVNRLIPKFFLMPWEKVTGSSPYSSWRVDAIGIQERTIVPHTSTPLPPLCINSALVWDSWVWIRGA